MVRTFLCFILRLALRLFFRRIELDGAERLPRDAALIFVLNHPNALVDPLFLLCLAPRRVSFLAKAPLFRMPLLGFFVRAVDSLPVYRAQEGDTRRNAETFAQARALLRAGRAIAIFPEGMTHSDPKLRPLKTGAARLALGTAGADLGVPLYIVPAGLYYTDKHLFRSQALLHFGTPIPVGETPLGHGRESAPASERAAEDSPARLQTSGARPSNDTSTAHPRQAVRDLSERIRAGLLEVTVNADDEQALRWIERGQRLFSDGGTLADELQMRRRFAEGYAWYRKTAPQRLAALELRIETYEASAQEAGLPPQTVEGGRAWTLALLPLAIVGAVVNWPLYRLIGAAASRFDNTSKSTVKMGLSLLCFPLLWASAAMLSWHSLGGRAAVLTAILAPLGGWCAVLFQEGWTGWRASRGAHSYSAENVALVHEREAIRSVITGLAEALPAVGDVRPRA